MDSWEPLYWNDLFAVAEKMKATGMGEEQVGFMTNVTVGGIYLKVFFYKNADGEIEGRPDELEWEGQT